MKGHGSSVTPVEAGIHTDFETLLTKFVDEQTVRFEAFARCFKEFKISLIYCGRTTEAEFRELAEKALVLAMSFCFEPYSFQCRFGGLYLAYSLYYTQPAKYHSKIRITVEQWIQLLVFVGQLREQQHFDGCYVFERLVRDCAFYVCAFSTEHSPLTYRRFDNRHDTERVVDILKSERPVVQALAEGPLIDQLGLIHDNYYKLKCQLAGDGALEPSAALSLVVDNPSDTIKRMVEECVAKMENRLSAPRAGIAGAKAKKKKEKRHSDEPEKAIVNRRSEIKKRAYSELSVPNRSRRNRQPVGETSRVTGGAEQEPEPVPSTSTAGLQDPDDVPLLSPASILARGMLREHEQSATASDSGSTGSPRKRSPRKGSSGVKGRMSQARKSGSGRSKRRTKMIPLESEDGEEPSTSIRNPHRSGLRQDSQSSTAEEGTPVTTGLDDDAMNIEASIQSIIEGTTVRRRRRPRHSSGMSATGSAKGSPVKAKRTEEGTPKRKSLMRKAKTSPDKSKKAKK